MAYRYTTPAHRVRSELLGEIHAELSTGRCGNHRPDGFCLVPAQVFHRVVENRKGVFTRTREPKLAAHRLRARWT